MTSEQFTSLKIDFKESDKASVYYAHLQNVFKELCLNNSQQAYTKEEPLISKIDRVLYDVFF